MSQINVTRSSMPDFGEYMDEIKELWDSRLLTNGGVKHRALQAMLEDYLEVPHVVLFANGHLALEYALSVLDLPQGGEIITTPFTFASTVHAIVRSGFVPVFCDIKPDDYTVDPEKLEVLITDKTVAILPVHVYGNLCDAEEIDRVAKKRGIPVIYDGAHAFGVSKNGVSAASFGDITMFSFHATKVFGTAEGGALCFGNGDYASRLDSMKNFGIDGEDCTFAGGNAKMSELHAAMGICNLRHLDEEIGKRRVAAEEYYRILGGVKGIKLCVPNDEYKYNYAYLPVLFDGYKYSRDEISDKLAADGIFARKYFYPAVNGMSCYMDRFNPEETPVARHISENILTLPLYADLSVEDVRRICEIILK